MHIGRTRCCVLCCCSPSVVGTMHRCDRRADPTANDSWARRFRLGLCPGAPRLAYAVQLLHAGVNSLSLPHDENHVLTRAIAFFGNCPCAPFVPNHRRHRHNVTSTARPSTYRAKSGIFSSASLLSHTSISTRDFYTSVNPHALSMIQHILFCNIETHSSVDFCYHRCKIRLPDCVVSRVYKDGASS
jgi:hypothetical protein